MSQIGHQVSLLTEHFLKTDDGNKGEEIKEGENKGKEKKKRKTSSSRASSPPPPKRQSVMHSLPIPSRALLEQFDIPFTRPPIPEPSDPNIIAKEKKKSDFVRTFRICLRMIGIDLAEWDKWFVAYRKRQQEEKKSVISKDHASMIKLEESIFEAIKTEVYIRLNAQEKEKEDD